MLLPALLPAALFAQAPANPLTMGSKAIYNLVIGNVVKAAQEMPEENYSFKPTPEVRSFGQVVAHVADAQYGFCGAATADSTKGPGVEKNITAKADIIKALQDAVAYCNKAFDGLTDAKGAEIIKFFGHPTPKLTILDFNTAHTDEHYGNIVTYLRLKGLTPPSSQQ